MFSGLFLQDTSDGPFWKQGDAPYTCVIASPKKESKFHGMKSFIAYQVTPSVSVRVSGTLMAPSVRESGTCHLLPSNPAHADQSSRYFEVVD